MRILVKICRLGVDLQCILKHVVGIIFTIFIFAQVSQGQTLSPEEETWIQEHPVVKVTNEMDWVPIDFVRSGEPAGFSIDYMNLIAAKVGLKIEYVHDYSWVELVERLKAREIDIVHSLNKNPQREEFLNFSKPYLELSTVYFGQTGAKPIEKYEDLLDKRMAIVTGWSAQNAYEGNYPELTVVEYPTVKEALVALSIGQVDLYSGALSTTNYIIAKNFISGLAVLGEEISPKKLNISQFHIAARSDWPMLMTILNKGMAAVTEAEYMEISQKWLSEFNAVGEIGLTQEEQQWLEENKTIRVAASLASRPYEFIDESGNISGISGSYLKEISELLNVEFIWSENNSWSDGILKIQSGEAEIMSFATPTPEREKFLIFTDSNMSFLQVIFSRDGENKYTDLDFMDGAVLAQSKGGAIVDFLKQDYPNIKIKEVDSSAEALLLVSNGEADAYIGNIPSTSLIIANSRIANVSVSGSTPYNVETGIAVRSDLTLLASALQKALDIIPNDKRAEIYAQWLTVKVENEQDYQLIITVIMIAVAIIAIIFIWAISLRIEVKRRLAIEKKLLLSQQEADEANQAKSTFLANMSHEIRTPLNAIIGFSEVMLTGIYGKIGHPKYVEYLRDIEYSGHHLETVINDILDLSKIEAGKWKLDEGEFDLNECIDRAIKLIELQAKNKNITFNKKGPSTDKIIKIYGDETAYMRIFINLLSNAVKFTEEGGNVSANVSVCFDGTVTVDIKDSGIGIPESRIKEVLKPFSQAHEIRGMEKRGTGLGLPIVIKLSELHGGTFSLSSKENIGTVATILIPSSRVTVREIMVESNVTFLKRP